MGSIFSKGELDLSGRTLTENLSTRKPSWAVASISHYDSSFLAGLVMAIKPKKLVEVGVASGWGSYILLQALKEAGVKDYEFIGVDISERFFSNPNYGTGQVVYDIGPEFAPNYRLFLDRAISEVAPEIGPGIDFAFIDAHHMHPWATLDMLALLPFLKPKAWVALHDLTLCLREEQNHTNRGPKHLYFSWLGEK